MSNLQTDAVVILSTLQEDTDATNVTTVTSATATIITDTAIDASEMPKLKYINVSSDLHGLDHG